MAAMGDNFPHSVIFCAISGKNLAPHRKVTVLDVARSSREPRLETGTWRTTNVNREDLQRVNNEVFPKSKSEPSRDRTSGVLSDHLEIVLGYIHTITIFRGWNFLMSTRMMIDAMDPHDLRQNGSAVWAKTDSTTALCAAPSYRYAL